MSKLFKSIIFLLIMSGQPILAQTSLDIRTLMPKPTDFTAMWWRDGFPGKIEHADWRRVTQTGNYWFLLDTDTVTIPRLGSGKINDVPGVQLSLEILVDGKSYRCRRGGKFSQFKGPRVIESGRFLQRQDITDLEFVSEDGENLNVDARFEAAAWPDQLSLSLAARPGFVKLTAGEQSWGRYAGGFGLTGENQYRIAETEFAIPGQFTVAFWVLPDVEFFAAEHQPWLLCYGAHEEVNGHFGILLDKQGIPTLSMNMGGGRENVIRQRASNERLRLNEWTHVAITYDGSKATLLLNGRDVIEKRIDAPRSASKDLMAIGGRGDRSPGYAFRGVLDELYILNRAVGESEFGILTQPHDTVKTAGLNPVVYRGFNVNKAGRESIPRERLKEGRLKISISRDGKSIESQAPFINQDDRESRAFIRIDPSRFSELPNKSVLKVEAIDKHHGGKRPVAFEPEIGWHRINLDGVEPILPEGSRRASNDSLEKIKLVLSNPTSQEQVARLMFEKTRGGIMQRIGQTITGMSAVLRDAEGNPTGLPVQLSKNWHFHDKGGIYSGLWFHGISQVRLAPKQTLELELVIAYGHWGGVAAASHSQLSLIGWGFNQVWDQSALGSWGESICYEPEQAMTTNIITDVRPLMVHGMKSRQKKWNWTNNVGGGDFFRLFDAKGKHQLHTSVRVDYKKVGPCLTEVNYRGGIGQLPISQESTVSISRTDDVVCGTYRLKMYVNEPIDFSRFVIFQSGADTYSSSKQRKLAVGDATGLITEWSSRWGGNTYHGKPIKLVGPNPWASFHDTVIKPNSGAWANRGFIIREWRAQLGGKQVKPWIAERGVGDQEWSKNSTLDIIPPPDVKRLQKGDFVEATIEHVIVPQFANDYYGPNQELRQALQTDQNTWKMIHRHVVGDEVELVVEQGELLHQYPDVAIKVDERQTAKFTIRGGLGYVPFTFSDLATHRGYQLLIDNQVVDQSIHGKDYWQTNYDEQSGKWSQTYNLKIPAGKVVNVTFEKQ